MSLPAGPTSVEIVGFSEAASPTTDGASIKNGENAPTHTQKHKHFELLW